MSHEHEYLLPKNIHMIYTKLLPNPWTRSIPDFLKQEFMIDLSELAYNYYYDLSKDICAPLVLIN
jgi:hypothetical protein